MKKQKLAIRIAAVIIAAILAFGTVVTVSAESISDRLLKSVTTKYDDSINESYLSATRLYVGDTLTMAAQVKGVDPKTCTYAFCIRPKGLFWFTLYGFGERSVFYWTPETIGDYEICIKVKSGKTIGKKYFDVRVTRELYNNSYVSTAFIQRGSDVEMNSRFEGGFGNVLSAFYCKQSTEDLWTTLSDYSTADFLKWRPTKTGDYDICIKVKDDDDQVRDQYFKLTVSEKLPKTPAEFTITVKSPIASPYFWRCELSDENILDYSVTEKPAEIEDLKAYVLLEYHFRTKNAGRTDIEFTYDTYNGEKYTVSYDVTVDRNLNYTVNKSDGTYFEKKLPEAEQVTDSFVISLSKPGAGARWTFDISDNLVADIAKSDTTGIDENKYTFTVFRKGNFTITFTCASVSDKTGIYKLIYDLAVDDDLKVTVYNKGGFYEPYTPIPDPVQ